MRLRPRTTDDIPKFRLQDLLVEAVRSLGAKPSRLVLTSLGTVVGIASLVMTIGFAQTAAGQVASQFAAAATTHVVVTANSAADGQDPANQLPWDADSRVRQVHGVVAAGIDAVVDEGEDDISALALNDPSQPERQNPTLIAASSGLFAAVGARVRTGRVFDVGNEARVDRVAVLGVRAARRLGIDRLDNLPSISIGDESFTVEGIIDRAGARPDLLDDVIVPMSVGREVFGVEAPLEVQVRVVPGADSLVARQAPAAILPNSPTSLSVLRTAAASGLRSNVEADLNVVFVLLGALALIVGIFGIATVTQLSVIERIGEIGLRRALGARQRDISGQFLAESLVVGLLGGLVGAAVGVLVLVITSIVRGWVPIIDPWLTIGAVAAAAVAGLVAGVVPAYRASRIEPAKALSGEST